jgi:hypothetical protein
MLGSTDRKELLSLKPVKELLDEVRLWDPPLTLLLQPTVVRISLLVLEVLGGGFVVRVRLTDLDLVTGVLLVDLDRWTADVAGGRLPDRGFAAETLLVTLFLRAVLDDRSR